MARYGLTLTILMSFMVFVVVKAEDENKNCSCECLVLDRIVGVLTDIKQMKDDMQIFEENVKLNLEKRLGEMKATLYQQQQSLIVVNKTLESVSTPLVAFSAYNPADWTPLKGEIVVFRNVYINTGGGYDTRYGIFTAPVRGLYQFTAHFCNASGKVIVFALFLEQEKIAVSLTFDGCASVNALTMMQERQTVTVRGDFEHNEFYDNVHRKASFIGLLVHL